MYFENVNALLNMDGHGLYVWLAYGISLVIFCFLLVYPSLKKRNMLKIIATRKQLQQEQQATASGSGIESQASEKNKRGDI